jgi:RecA/RadA recombinase
MDKDNIREELIKNFKKEFPDSPLEPMDKSELAEIPSWITTGNYALNWGISKDMFRGLPGGRVVLLSGDPSSGKSMISLSMMREPSIDLIIYLDSEGGSVTKEFARFLGIDTKKILYSQVDTVEELKTRMALTIDTIEKNKSSKKVLMIIDSISMITTDKEKNPEAGADMGNRAKLMRSFFRQYVRKMQKMNICVVGTAHLTENIGGYGPSKIVSGGTIFGYVPSVEVRFSKINAESETERTAVGTSLVKIRAEMVKSRLGTLGKIVKFDLDLQTGLDPYAGIADILKDYQFVIPAAKDVEEQIKNKETPKKSTGWWMFKPWDCPPVSVLISKMREENLLTVDGKFRDDKIKEWSKDVPWFLKEIQRVLDSVYAEDEFKTESTETEEPIEENSAETPVQEKPTRRKRGAGVSVMETIAEPPAEEIVETTPITQVTEPASV